MIRITGIDPLQSISVDVQADVLIIFVSTLEKRRYVASITHFFFFFNTDGLKSCTNEKLVFLHLKRSLEDFWSSHG